MSVSIMLKKNCYFINKTIQFFESIKNRAHIYNLIKITYNFIGK